MAETAMRDANGNPVFVRDTGEYSERFPSENIVRESNDSNTGFIVYGFVGTEGSFEEERWFFVKEEEAIEKATEIYGQTNVDRFTRDGEVFDVEVHEVSQETFSDLKD